MTTCIRRGEYVVFTTCQCPPCLTRRHKVDKLRRTGRLERVPSAAAWTVIEALWGRGLSRRAVASAIPGVPDGLVTDALDLWLLTGNRQNFGRFYAAKIASVGVDAEPAYGLIVAVGTTRRLRALAYMGHDLGKVESVSGINRNRLAYLRRGQLKTQVDAVEAIKTAYDALSMTFGDSTLARNLARKEGWFPPLAWDEGAIDAPDAVPAAPAVRACHIEWEDVAFLRRLGVGDEQVAARLGISSAQALKKAGWRRARSAVRA